MSLRVPLRRRGKGKTVHKVGTILGEFWRNIWWKITEALVTKLNIYLEEDFQGIILRNEVQIHPI